MKRQSLFLCLLALSLTGCALTPLQKAEREAKRIRAEQRLQVQLTKQCDPELADWLAQRFNPPLTPDPHAEKAHDSRYQQKVNDPVFQACYKMARENYHAQEELRYLRMHYDDARFGFGFSRFCYYCW